jgi:hypothetical protein
MYATAGACRVPAGIVWPGLYAVGGAIGAGVGAIIGYRIGR